MAGEFSSNQRVILHDMLLPEIHQDIVLPEVQACVFTASCRYDRILGRNALCHFQIILGFNNNIIKSSTSSVPMCSFQANFQGPQTLAQQLRLDAIDSICSPNDPQESFALHNISEPNSKILAADYRSVDIQTAAQNCTNLSQDQQNSLVSVLYDFTNMFGGTLKHYLDEEIHLDIDPSIHPH